MNLPASQLPGIIIVGATSAIARHCARHWLSRPARVLLAGRDEARLQREAEDLQVRSPESTIRVTSLDFLDPAAIEQMVADFAGEGGIDLALIAHGSLPDQQSAQAELARNSEALALNGISPALFMEAIAGRMALAGKGRLGVIGSVAGDRGRKSNYIYGAAKALLDRYAQGLQHRLADTDVRVSLIKPGPTLTPMTAHLAETGTRLAPVEEVAAAIVKGMEKGNAVIYAPGKWRLIMLVIQHLPRIVFNRLDI